MGNLGETLMEELNCETVFSIGGIGISESVVVTWIIMAAVTLASILLTRNLKVEHPGRGQIMLEYAVTLVAEHRKGHRRGRSRRICALSDFGPDLSGHSQSDRYPWI